MLLFRIFGLLTSALLLYSERFGWYVLWLSSDVSCQTQESTQNLEMKPLFEPQFQFCYAWPSTSIKLEQGFLDILTCCWDWTNHMIWSGWVLWHVNYFRLFNAKSSLYIYIKCIWFGWVGFLGTSTTVGYLIANHHYTYIFHHHHVVPPARISLTLSRHFSLSFIASSRSSELHPASSHSCCM